MEKLSLKIYFQTVNNKKYPLKINDVRSDVTGEEASLLANKILEKNAIFYDGNHLVDYINAELEKVSVEELELQ